MQQHFVEYPLALKLKEAGFNEPCVSWFVDETLLVDHGFYGSDLDGFKAEVVRAPIYQQVFDWLDSQGIYVNFPHMGSFYIISITDFKNQILCKDRNHKGLPNIYKTRKQAWDRAIEVALELLKKKDGK